MRGDIDAFDLGFMCDEIASKLLACLMVPFDFLARSMISSAYSTPILFLEETHASSRIRAFIPLRELQVDYRLRICPIMAVNGINHVQENSSRHGLCSRGFAQEIEEC